MDYAWLPIFDDKHQIDPPTAALSSRDVCQLPKFAGAVVTYFTLSLETLVHMQAKNGGGPGQIVIV